MSNEEMVKEAVEEAKAKAAQEEAQAENAPADGEADAETADSGKAETAEDSSADGAETDGEDPDGADGDAGDASKAEKKKLFGKKNKKDKKDEKIDELTDRLTRQMAEFDNFRKRTEKEKSHMYEVGARDVIEKILPVVDNFERGLAAVPEEQKNDPVIDGMDKIYRQLMTVLADLGVEPIEAVGKEFDPNFHNAVMHVEDEELGENIVAEEFQKGYLYKDTVVRHSMVKVAN